MDEYISRKAAIAEIKNFYPGIPLAKIRLQKWHEENKNFMDCELAIERIPAADVVPVRHGRWIKDDISGLLHCSHCGIDAPLDTIGPTQYESRFCPRCGADMEGGA